MNALQTVTVLIPAYNEAARIGSVLAAVAGHPDVLDVLVVDDCSSDDTADVAAGVPGVTVLRLAKNGGKTKALAAGLHAARGDLVALIDADLQGLTPADLAMLIAPVRAGKAAVSISLRGNGPRLWQWIGLDYISGERVLPKALLMPVLAELQALPKFGFEVHLNRMILAQGLPIKVVRWPGVTSPAKARKYGLMAGIRGDVGMIADMMRTVPPLELARQIIGLRRLRV
jgi:glycosyltransferase involved in cell wall biosynthesis